MSLAETSASRNLMFGVLRKKITAVTFIGALFSTTEARAADNAKHLSELVLTQLIDDVGAAERIEAADQLRTLSQEVSSAACFLFSGIDVEESRRLVIEARDRFDRNIDALLNGNPSMNIIGKEKRRKTVAELEALNEIWVPVAAAINALLDDPSNKASIKIIKSNSMPLFEKTNRLVSELSGEYSNPAELLQVDALMLDIVGRQGMLTQKIAKNACKVWNGEELPQTTVALTGAMEMFETSLAALLNGMPEAGLLAAPTPEIADALSGLISDWQDTRPMVDTLIADGSLAQDAQVALFRRMNDKMYRLEKVTHDYAIYSKHKYQ